MLEGNAGCLINHTFEEGVAAIGATYEELTETQHKILVSECDTIPWLLAKIEDLELKNKKLVNRAKDVAREHRRKMKILNTQLKVENGVLMGQKEGLQRRIDYLIHHGNAVIAVPGNRCRMSSIRNRPTGVLIAKSNDCWLLKSKLLPDGTEDPYNPLCSQPHKRQAKNIRMCTYNHLVL